MSEASGSRRDFLRQAAVTAAAGTLPRNASPQRPPGVWIIIAVDWESGEFTYPQGEHVFLKAYFSKADADAECRRLCEEFCALETPQDFGADIANYLWQRAAEPDFDESSVTWEELFAAGFPEPYEVVELEV